MCKTNKDTLFILPFAQLLFVSVLQQDADIFILQIGEGELNTH